MKKTPLHTIHTDMKAKMAEFAGYDMPIQYPDGVMAEHNWTRHNAGLFDVSHMGQIMLRGPGVVNLLEKLTPSSFAALPQNAAKYTVMTNEDGGIIDDLIITRRGPEEFFAVINAGCKDKDIDWIESRLPGDVTLEHLEDRALVALQGPAAENVLRETLGINTADLGYMRLMEHGPCWISRLGYTGEDGFELSVPSRDAGTLWTKLLSNPAVKAVGLAARDSLRLEMGYPLYGHDIDATTSPVEANLTWVMGKKTNRTFIGASRVLRELETGAGRKRVGVRLADKGVAREGAEIFSASGKKIGVLTSGGFSPTLQTALGQGYVEAHSTIVGTDIFVRVRGRDIAATVAAMPFVPAKTKPSGKKAA